MTNTETHEKQQQKTARRSKRPAPPVDLGFIPAKELIGRTILILGISSWWDHYNRRMVSARFDDGRSFYFPAGIAVEQQLLNKQVSFPVWVRITWQEGERGFYLLKVADTISLNKIKQ